MTTRKIFRTTKSAEFPFTRIDNRLLTDASLSFAARGMMCYLLSKPDNWALVKENLINNSPAGETAITNILKELQEAGYVQQSRSRTSSGQYKRSEFFLFEHKSLNSNADQEPIQDNPQRSTHTGKPSVDKPVRVNLRLVTKDVSNKGKKTTTPKTNLIWPTKVKVSQMQRQSILEMVVGVDYEVIQNILDEMQSTTKVIKNPVAYFYDLLDKYKNGTYIRSGAIAESEKRETIEQADERYEAAKNESIRRGEELLAQHSKLPLNQKIV